MPITLLLVGDKWQAKTHKTGAAAQEYADSVGKFERGWIADTKEGLVEGDGPLTIEEMNAAIASLQPESPPSFSAGEDGTALDYLWRLLTRKSASPAKAKSSTEADSEADEGTMAAKKVKKVKKVAKAPKKEATVKKVAKVAKKAGNGTNGHAGRQRGYGEAWNKTLAAFGKKDKVTMEEMKELCEKNGVKAWFLRFVRAGVLAQVERGVYRLTAEGRKRIGG